MTQESLGKSDVRTIIPPEEKSAMKELIRAYSSELLKTHDDLIRLDVRFFKSFCTIRIYQEPFGSFQSCSQKIRDSEEMREKLRNTPSPLCRLTYIAPKRWTLSIYNFCKDKYEPSPFLTGRMEGTPEEGFETAMEYFYGKKKKKNDYPG
ncbi:hypothetical protein [Methanospirillum hungatei]|uniref:hypothetical protein n=1 Tax=Methanospirillum hungatei TaxID=2203 RepID=UPI0026EE10A1|nr:hypothetical protein [Methanospirillum hungatei]MCA1915794.1 hypothetical protein [Methanospirillum hungatei]